MSRWPWRLGLVAFGLTTAVLAALVTSATLSPQPSRPRRVPTLVLPAVQAEPATRSESTPTTGPREPTTAPTLSTRSIPIPDTVPLAVSRPTTTPGPARAQAPATAGRTRITEALSTVGASTIQPPVTTPTPTTAPTTTTAATTTTTTAPTATAAPTTTLATPTSTEPTTTEPTTTRAGDPLIP
jgi:hypothetical protein